MSTTQAQERATVVRASKKVDDWLASGCTGEPPRTSIALLRTIVDAVLATPPSAAPSVDGLRYYLCDALAMQLAENDGHEGDDKHRLVWTGGAVPEPEGEVWQRYTGEAAQLVQKAFATVAGWEARDDAFIAELSDDTAQPAQVQEPLSAKGIEACAMAFAGESAWPWICESERDTYRARARKALTAAWGVQLTKEGER